MDELSPETDRDAVMVGLVDILQRRAVAFGADDIDIQRQDSNRISVTLWGVVTEEDARKLLKSTAQFEIRQAHLNEDGDIVCQAPNGVQFSVSPEDITYTREDPEDRLTPRCPGTGGQNGDIIWEAVDPNNRQGPSEDGTTPIMPPFRATVVRMGAPAVIVDFSPRDRVLLEQITTQLVGLPLGIFVDGELLAGPTIQEPITTGKLIISSLSLPQAYILGAQLTAGALPVPVKEIGNEGTSR